MTHWRLEVETARCVGSGMCAGVAPGLFTVVDGHSRPLVTRVPAAEIDPALAAATCCPMEAIRIVDQTTGAVVSGSDG